MTENNQSSPNRLNTTEDSVDIKELVFSILRNWYWILLCVGLGFFCARMYLRYSAPVYQASGKILIKDQESNSGGGLSEEAVLQEIGILKVGNNIENEIQILRSRTLMKQVIEELGLDVQYIGLGRLKNTEYYGGTSPIIIDSVHWGLDQHAARLEVEWNNQNEFILFGNDDTESVHRFADPLILANDTFWLRSNYREETDINRLQIILGINPNLLLLKLNIRTTGEYSSVLNLEMVDPVPQKASDILNKLIEVYNQEAIDDKNQVAEKTLQFINERLVLLTEELSNVEGGLENYKESNEISVEASSTVDFILTQISDLDNERTRQEIRLELLETVQKILARNAERFELIPANVVLDDAGGLDEQINLYNAMVLDWERLQRAAGTGNEQLILLSQQLQNIRMNILNSVENLRQGIQVSMRETENKLAQLQKRINQIPRQERELLEIKRQQNIKEALYLFLLQKKEETALSAAITVPNARVIDPAITWPVPISPKPLQAYAIFLMLGFAVPVGIIFLRELLDNKIYSRNDIMVLTQTPILGSIIQNKSIHPIVVKPGSRTAIAEMFRLLRTNLNYLSREKTTQSVLITSGMGGDGKTFTAVNLGISLALTNKRVILLGMDLRKPKLSRYLMEEPDANTTGITNFLIGASELNQIINRSELSENLFFISSGPIPPNPAELLSGERARLLFEQLQDRFDYIIIDTAPVNLVADAFLLEPFTDITLFAVRYGKTNQETIRELELMRSGRKLKNPAIVLNGVKKGKGYGYGYQNTYKNSYGHGYYQDDKPKSKWRKIFGR